MSSADSRIPDGLEVVPSAGPEYVRHGGLEVYGGHLNDKGIGSTHLQQIEPQTHHRTRSLIQRPKIIVIAVIVLLAVVGIVVGAVVGTRTHNGSSSASTTPTGTSPPSAGSPTATGSSSTPTSSSSDSLRANSALSVTGWASTTGYSIRLFYQGGDGKIRLSSFDSSSGVWDSPQVLDIGAKAGTPLGASSIAEQFYFGFTNDKSVCILRRTLPRR
jgi:hypothetical protein